MAFFTLHILLNTAFGGFSFLTVFHFEMHIFHQLSSFNRVHFYASAKDSPKPVKAPAVAAAKQGMKKTADIVKAKLTKTAVKAPPKSAPPPKAAPKVSSVFVVVTDD